MDNTTTIDKLIKVFCVTFKYDGSERIYPAACFATKELAESYVRYSKLQPYNDLVVEWSIIDYPFYTLDFEATHYKNAQVKLEF